MGGRARRGAVVLLALALLSGCALDVRTPLVGSSGALLLEDALGSYVRGQVPGSSGMALIGSQPWRASQALLFSFEATDAHGRRLPYLGVAFAERSGLLGWRVTRIYTVARQPDARARMVELYVGTGLLPGNTRFYTRAIGRLNIGGARRALLSYSDGEDGVVVLANGYFMDLHEGRAEVRSIAALDAAGGIIGTPIPR